MLTVAEASKKLGISRCAAYRLLNTRRLGHYRIGGKIMISPDDIDAFLQLCRVNANMPSTAASHPRLKHIKLTHASLAPTDSSDFE
jgi:excisionase family DNA binding protein